MESLTLAPVAGVNGTIDLPGSKSVSNRALLLAALAEGTTTLSNLLASDDVTHMLHSLAALGVNCHLEDNNRRCSVQGIGRPFTHDITHNTLELFLGNAGTAMRPLCAALCLGKGKYTLTGEPRMEERPIKDLVTALIQAGADIEYLRHEGYPPLRINASGLRGGDITIDGSVSSQFLTALLMAAPMARQPSAITVKNDLVSKPYIDITLQMMQRFGIEVENHAYRKFIIEVGRCYRSPGRFLVEGDATSASYFLAAAAIKGGTVRVNGVGRSSMQGDVQFAGVLEKMGARITWGEEFIEAQKDELHGVDLDLNHIPDAAMTIATTALFAQGTTHIRNIYNWRVKETDRLAAMATELR
ncbi:MAG: 3-phosphoshikimate 1-carboxyvinyltransferase, partial [Desulfopila sp.]